MSELNQLIEQLCPNGVEIQKLADVARVERGRRVVREQLSQESGYPVYQNSLTAMGFHTESNYPENTTFVIGAGAAGEIGYSTEAFWAADDCFPIACSSALLDRYVFHTLMWQKSFIASKVRKASIPRLSRDVIENLTIPVPPVEIQSEIVRILDSFTELTVELTAELTAELAARKQQYEYYREKLLGIEAGNFTTIKTIGEVAVYRRGSFPQPYGKPEWYDGEGAMPFVQVADIGEDMRLVSDTKRKISKVAQFKSVFAPKGSIIISLQGSIGRVAITQYDAYIDRTVAIFHDISKELLPKYFVYQLQRVFAEKEKTARGSTIKTITKEEFTAFSIAIPPLEEQERIVAILDRFNDLHNDISAGLPTEIEARQKQYEYYRDKLLTFKELNENAG